VVGADAFKAEQVGAGVYRIGAGVAIVKGAIGGIVNAKQITAKPALGAVMHIVLRLDTTNGGRKVTLEAVASMEADSVEQLEQGGMHDLPLYAVEGTSGGYVLADRRAYCTSFDNSVYSQDFQALYDGARNDTEALLDSLRVNMAAAMAEANADTAGMYGSAGRQGFINPNFAVNQRNGAYSLKSGELFTFDHWKAAIEGRAASGEVYVYKNWGDDKRLALQIENAAYASGTAAATSCISQTIENGVFDFCNAGKRFTVSFDAKADAPQRVAVEPVQYAFGNSQAIAAQVVEVTKEWQRFSLTFEGTITTASNSGGENFDWLKIPFYFAWANNAARFGADQNAANSVYFANMQINAGTAALPCYEPPYGEQLHQCQRYYCEFGNVSLSAGATLASTNQAMTGPLPLPRAMYRKPDVTVTDRAGASGVASAEIAAGGWRNGLACGVSDLHADGAAFIVTNTDASAVTRVCFGKVKLNAEIND
jgi:hypothetical protein